MKRVAMAVAVVLCSLAFAQAGPLAPGDVAADAQWFGHFNGEAIHALPIVKQAQKCLSECPSAPKMKEFFDKLGVNPLEDFLGATVYGTQYGGKSTVVLVYLRKYDREKIIDFFKDRSTDHQSEPSGANTVYSCKLKLHGKETPLVGAFAKDNLIVMGTCRKCVGAALEVLEGKKPALAKDAPLVKGISAGALFVARAPAVPESIRSTTKCPILRVCKSGSVEWSESKGAIHARYELQTVSAETAANFKAIVDGGLAMLAIRGDQVPAEIKKLATAVKCEVQGERFKLTWQASQGDLEAAAKAAHAMHKAHGGHCPLGKCPLGCGAPGGCPVGGCPLDKKAGDKCACPSDKCPVHKPAEKK